MTTLSHSHKGTAKIGNLGLLNADRKALLRIYRLGLGAAYLALHNADAIHYSQHLDRWAGIDQHLRSYRGQFPTTIDCSAFATWVLWDATRGYHAADTDFANGADWKSGHTGTLVQHGRKLRPRERMRPLDLVFYGDEGWRPAHVAIYVGGGKVISHGSEAGPFLLNVNYRSDVGIWATRRYVH